MVMVSIQKFQIIVLVSNWIKYWSNYWFDSKFWLFTQHYCKLKFTDILAKIRTRHMLHL